ncbi:hypothetical protein D9757_014517 [Collybiopsis confluens]|uniref:Protein kinase domain-containing protein n=1 Tax=Collybiopsis confluens TaxID=2823264 RepID=A0A8H5LMN5_9AGAR|nr:hypothetical protein D9757_014517 [Collybiopsis confluens]
MVPTAPEPPDVARNSYYSLVYEIGGKILDLLAIPHDRIANPLCIFAMEEYIAPKIRELDPTCRLERPLIVETGLYRITSEAFRNLYRRSQIESKAINLRGAELFKVDIEEPLSDYTLVIFHTGSTPVEEDRDPFFVTEPTLASQLPPLNPSSSVLYPSFIKVKSGGKFRIEDLEYNNIVYISEDSVTNDTVPPHVQEEWDALAQSRSLTPELLAQLRLMLGSFHISDAFLDELFTSISSAEIELKAESSGTNQNIIRNRLVEETRHYSHIINFDEICAPMNTFSPKLGVERTSEFFFFTVLAVHFRRFLPEFDVLDPYQTMPITKLIIEKLDETEDDFKYAPYYPKSDLGIWYHATIWPGALMELHSGAHKTMRIEESEDHIRMFLQGASLLRMMNIAKRNTHGLSDELSQQTVTLPLVYVTKDWTRASIYLLFEVGSKVYYLHRTYDLQSTLYHRLRFTRDMYNLVNHIEKSAPSQQLRISLNLMDLQLGCIRTVANRVDKAEDKKRKRNVDQTPEEGQSGIQNKRNTRDKSESEGVEEEEEFASDEEERASDEEEEFVADEEEEFIADGLHDGYKFLAKSLGLLVGEGPKGNQVVAKKVQATSAELKIYMSLQRAYRHEDFILPTLKRFDFPPQGPTTVTYLVFPRWIPLSELRHLELNASQIVALCSGLASGVDFLHSQLVAHLDLKPDNLVIQRNGGEVELRIIDFSISVLLNARNDLCSTYQGTPGFMAPEVSACEESDGSTDSTDIRYSPLKADLFSCGRVFLYLAWWVVNTPEFSRVLGWGKNLSAQDPGSRPELREMSGLLPPEPVISPYKLSPTLINAHLGVAGQTYHYSSSSSHESQATISLFGSDLEEFK